MSCYVVMLYVGHLTLQTKPRQMAKVFGTEHIHTDDTIRSDDKLRTAMTHLVNMHKQ